jgi:hypothetical protein
MKAMKESTNKSDVFSTITLKYLVGGRRETKIL